MLWREPPAEEDGHTDQPSQEEGDQERGQHLRPPQVQADQGRQLYVPRAHAAPVEQHERSEDDEGRQPPQERGTHAKPRPEPREQRGSDQTRVGQPIQDEPALHVHHRDHQQQRDEAPGQRQL